MCSQAASAAGSAFEVIGARYAPRLAPAQSATKKIAAVSHPAAKAMASAGSMGPTYAAPDGPSSATTTGRVAGEYGAPAATARAGRETAG